MARTMGRRGNPTPGRWETGRDTRFSRRLMDLVGAAGRGKRNFKVFFAIYIPDPSKPRGPGPRMSDTPAALSRAEVVAVSPAPDQSPVCFVVDADATIRHYISLIMQGSGIDTEEFADGPSCRAALSRRMPDLILLNVPLDTEDSIETVNALAAKAYRGAVLLMGGRGGAVMETVKATGDRLKLRMLPVLKKPFEAGAVQKVIRGLKLGTPPPLAARIGLVDALASDWIEFWYQPKVDLRRKRLVGAEAFARARHPEYGVLHPNAFMAGATEDDLIELAGRALIDAIRIGGQFARLNVSIPIAVNMPIAILERLPVADIMRKTPLAGGAGLIVDIDEKSVVGDIARAVDLATRLAPHNVRLAIDDVGRGVNLLGRNKSVPFAEMKLDRSFVTDCGSDKVKGPICKSAIELAHKFGALAVGVGVEKAGDVMALAAMGCDYGQGYLLGQPMPQPRFLSLLRQRAHSRDSVAAQRLQAQPA